MLDSTISKVIMLVIIAGVSFYNMEIAILLTVLFLLIVISSNKDVLMRHAVRAAKEPFIMKEFPEAVCKTTSYIAQEDVNPYNYFIDEKIKPYEEYIKRIGGPENVELASAGGSQLLL